MTSLTSRRAGALAIALACSAVASAACGGTVESAEPVIEQPAPAAPAAPAVSTPSAPACGLRPEAANATTTRLLLSRLELGDRGRLAGPNSFGARVLPLFTSTYPSPSAAWSGASFLQIDPDGSGLLFLVDVAGATVRVPLRAARITSTDGLSGTLAAVVPVSALANALRSDLPALGETFCSGETIDAVGARIREATDSVTSSAASPEAACDGISIALGFEGNTAEAPPAPKRTTCD